MEKKKLQHWVSKKTLNIMKTQVNTVEDIECNIKKTMWKRQMSAASNTVHSYLWRKQPLACEIKFQLRWTIPFPKCLHWFLYFQNKNKINHSFFLSWKENTSIITTLLKWALATSKHLKSTDVLLLPGNMNKKNSKTDSRWWKLFSTCLNVMGDASDLLQIRVCVASTSHHHVAVHGILAYNVRSVESDTDAYGNYVMNEVEKRCKAQKYNGCSEI